MTSEEKRQTIRVILREAEQQDDPRAAVQLIRLKISEMNDRGQEVPEELTEIQNRFVDECIYASQGR
ncbi:MAG: hypothetical protein AAGD43_03520 [Pseudomonadota bacterium]